MIDNLKIKSGLNNFIIVGTQRTGSSAIAEAVGLHPYITCGWEWTLREKRKNKIDFSKQALTGDFSILLNKHQDHMAKVFSSQTKWLGFRRLFRSSDKWILQPRFSPALWLDKFEEHLIWLSNNPNIHVIHIVRMDGIDWLKSMYVARKAKLYIGRPYPNNIRVHIPLWKAIRRLRSKNWVDIRLSSLSRSNPYIKIYYEEFLKDRNTITNILFDFLSCDQTINIFNRPKIYKQSRVGPKQYISNYSQLKKAVENVNLLEPGLV